MKTFMIATGLALASLAAPQAAFAQDQQGSAGIIVSGEFQKNWDRGNQLEAEGLSDLQKAQRDLVKHSAAVVNAQDLRDTSLSRAENAQAAFQSLAARPFVGDAEGARDWAKQAERLSSDWEKFSERSEKGARDFEKAQDRQNDAQDAVQKAEAKIEEGRALKAEAERASRRQARI